MTEWKIKAYTGSAERPSSRSAFRSRTPGYFAHVVDGDGEMTDAVPFGCNVCISPVIRNIDAQAGLGSEAELLAF